MSNPNGSGKVSMEVPRSVALITLALRLFQGGPVTSAYIREHYRVSRATANRYMLELDRALVLTRRWIDGAGDSPALELTMKGKT